MEVEFVPEVGEDAIGDVDVCDRTPCIDHAHMSKGNSRDKQEGTKLSVHFIMLQQIIRSPFWNYYMTILSTSHHRIAASSPGPSSPRARSWHDAVRMFSDPITVWCLPACIAYA